MPGQRLVSSVPIGGVGDGRSLKCVPGVALRDWGMRKAGRRAGYESGYDELE